MSKEKYRRNGLESENKDDSKRSENNLRASSKSLMSFDLYFQKLMASGNNIQAHHKAPMRKYAESNGLIEATEDDFDRIFKNY